MVQITFVTLLLGLLSGTQTVELAVAGPVAAVELRLDGESLGRQEGLPWLWDMDFGSELVPHELEARAFDAAGSEISRIQQWINLPRPPAEVVVALDGDPASGSAAVRLSWSTLVADTPKRVSLALDGRPLKVGRDGRATLPRLDLAVPHLLTAVVEFGPDVEARRDVVLGAEGAQAFGELTAVPVALRGGELPPAEKLHGWLAAGGEPLRVVATEAEPRQILVVRDVGTRLLLTKLAGPLLRQRIVNPEMALETADRVRFLVASPRRREGSEGSAELFDPSRDFLRRDGGMHRLLADVVFPQELSRSQHLADAVAVAGLQAFAGNHPRAVVLVLGPKPADASRYKPAAVRRYLAALRVPLYVWSIMPPPEEGSTEAVATMSPAAADWGGAEDISSRQKLAAAFARLQGELDRQRIVFLEGLHLPQSLRLTSAAVGLELP